MHAMQYVVQKCYRDCAVAVLSRNVEYSASGRPLHLTIDIQSWNRNSSYLFIEIEIYEYVVEKLLGHPLPQVPDRAPESTYLHKRHIIALFGSHLYASLSCALAPWCREHSLSSITTYINTCTPCSFILRHYVFGIFSRWSLTICRLDWSVVVRLFQGNILGLPTTNEVLTVFSKRVLSEMCPSQKK